MPQLASFTRAQPEEILAPVKPWFVVLTLFLGLIGNLIPLTGVALALKPVSGAATATGPCPDPGSDVHGALAP